jgi:hypothetical protein
MKHEWIVVLQRTIHDIPMCLLDMASMMVLEDTLYMGLSCSCSCSCSCSFDNTNLEHYYQINFIYLFIYSTSSPEN